MNIELLEQIKQHILDNPHNLDMDTYHNQCGTVACIAGWALIQNLGKDTVLETRKKLFKDHEKDQDNMAYFDWPMQKAAELFDITIDDARKLFLTDYWPDDFRSVYEDAEPLSFERAEITAQRIDHFIKTGN